MMKQRDTKRFLSPLSGLWVAIVAWTRGFTPGYLRLRLRRKSEERVLLRSNAGGEMRSDEICNAKLVRLFAPVSTARRVAPNGGNSLFGERMCERGAVQQGGANCRSSLAPGLVFGILICAISVCAGDAKPALPYPDDLRVFRKKALFADGAFVPDIAFTARVCPKCKATYIFGNFPRLSRQPFTSLQEVHQLVEGAASRGAPTPTMFSPGQGKEVPRACPQCGEAEGRGARADKAIFCHFIPETRDDLQIEYTFNSERKIATKTYWRMPYKEVGAGPLLDDSPEARAELSWGPAVKVELPDESEAAFQKEYKANFSLRGLWNAVLAEHWDKDKPYYREVSPGVFFIFRPKAMDVPSFGEFTGKKLMPDKKEGVYDRLESPLQLDARVYDYGTPLEWMKADTKALSDGTAEIYVGVNYAALRRAAIEVMASRRMTLVFKKAEEDKPLEGTVTYGAFNVDINLFPIAKEAAVGGLTLHQAVALFLTPPVYTLDSAERLRQRIVAVRPLCRAEMKDGRMLVLEDRLKKTRTIDLLRIAEKFEFENEYIFGLFVTSVLAWNDEKQCFGEELPKKEFSSIGYPAFVEKRIRPLGFLKERGLESALMEVGEDSKGRRFDLCYTWECPATLTYIDPKKEQFKEFTLDEAQKRYAAANGVLPVFYTGKDALFFPGDGRRTASCRVSIVVGQDIVSLAADPARAWGLAVTVANIGAAESLHLYAPTMNGILLAPRALAEDELKLARTRLQAVLAQYKVDAGAELQLHFDLPQTPPRGKVFRRSR